MPRRTTAYPDDPEPVRRRQETTPRPRSATRRFTGTHPAKRKEKLPDSIHPDMLEDTLTDEEQPPPRKRTNTMMEPEIQQLPVRMPRFGFGDYLSQQTCCMLTYAESFLLPARFPIALKL